MRIPILVLHCLILCLLVVVVSAQELSTTSNNQQVTLFEKRKPSQNTCSCPGCDSVDVSFLFSIDVGCGPCGTGYYVSRMDLLVTPIADYHTYIIETTSTTGSEKVPVLSQTQLRYNLGECFSGSTSLFLDTLSYSTKLTCKNAITQCKANVKNLCTCSKAPSKLVIVLPSVIEAGSKYTPEVRIVDADGNIVPRSYTIQLVIGSSSSYISMAVDGVMKAQEQTAPSSGKITFRASISTIITPAPSLTGDYIEKEVSAPFTCFGISSSSSSVCSGKGTCTSQNQCTCYTGYTGNICETVSGTSGVSSISLSVPASVNTGSAFTATVSMLDSSGSTYPSGSGTITLDLVDSTGITYSGDKSKVAVNGAASFSVTLSTSTAKTISLKAVYNSFSDTKSVAISVEKKDYALSWVGSYKVVEGCNKDTCCCLSGQVSVSRIGDNSVQVNSAVVGNCGGTSLYSFSIDNINSDTVINTSAHGTTFVISKSGDELAVTNQQASQCSGRALKSQGTMFVLNYFTILVSLVVVILLN